MVVFGRGGVLVGMVVSLKLMVIVSLRSEYMMRMCVSSVVCVMLK